LGQGGRHGCAGEACVPGVWVGGLGARGQARGAGVAGRVGGGSVGGVGYDRGGGELGAGGVEVLEVWYTTTLLLRSPMRLSPVGHSESPWACEHSEACSAWESHAQASEHVRHLSMGMGRA
jgi:hypothetical protein